MYEVLDLHFPCQRIYRCHRLAQDLSPTAFSPEGSSVMHGCPFWEMLYSRWVIVGPIVQLRSVSEQGFPHIDRYEGQ